MRRWLRRFAGAALVISFALVLALVALAAVFLARPEVLLTSRTAAAALRRFAAAYSPRWSSLRFSAAAFAPRRHRYTLRTADFCVGDRAGVFSGCFSELELCVVVSYSRRGPVIERIESLVAVAEGARLDLRRLEPRRAAGGVPAALRSTSVRTLRVELSRLTVVSAKTTVTGGVRAVLAPAGRRPLAVAADLRIRGPEGEDRLKAVFTADTDLLKGGPATYVDLVGRADLGPRGRARAAFRVRREAFRYVGSGSGEISLSSGPLRALRLAACQGTASAGPGAARPSGVLLDCRYELVTARPPAERFGSMKAAAGRVTLSAGLDGEQYRAALKADLDPISAWWTLTGDLSVLVAGRLDRPWNAATVSHELLAALQVPRFEDLVAFLRDTKHAVPAPIHVLKGPLAVALESRGDPRSVRPAVHYELSSDLAGPRQRLILRGAGDLAAVNAWAPGRSFEHAGELILKEVALELPRLDIGRAPKVLSDGRIKSADAMPAVPAPLAPAAGERPLRLRGTLVVRTGKPLLLFSNLAKDPVPVALDMTLAYPPVAAAGRVAVQRFDVELFRRSATVDHLNVSISSGSKTGALEGLIRYQATAAAIRIAILGTTEKPRIELSSIPPMKREDILALLIFGKGPEELDSEQTMSVRNTETALESRAFGLASLYLFGATPVEHVGYDSATRTASVKVRLPGGADLTLGSDFDQSRQLSVRKTLSPHWALQTEVSDQGQQSRAAATFLEWFNRY